MVDDRGPTGPDRPRCPPRSRPDVRVCLELDAAYRPAPGAHLGAMRSPVRTPAAAAARPGPSPAAPGSALVGMMAYEGQIAGVGNAVGGPRGAPCGRCSGGRPPNSPTAVPPPWPRCATWPTSSSSTAGAPGRWRPPRPKPPSPRSLPAPGFSDPACSTTTAASTRPRRHSSCCRWCAAPAAGSRRWPAAAGSPPDRPAPTGCLSSPTRPACGTSARRAPARCRPRSGAGPPTASPIGDKVWMRHAKSGELAEHVTEVHLVTEGAVAEAWPTYRGEGQAF